MTRIAITPRAFRSERRHHEDLLASYDLQPMYPSQERPLRVDEMIDFVRDCRGLIVGVDPVTDAVLASGPLQVVVKFGSGTDNLDFEAAVKRGVRVSSTAGTNARSVAELAIGLIFALARRIPAHDRGMRSGSWRRTAGMELVGKRLGIVGLGSVGKEVAAIATGIGLEVVAHDPYVLEAGLPLVELDELLSECDIVTLHLPFTDETRDLIDAGRIAMMRPGALLVNTARAGIVNEHSLARSLEEGRLAGAAFDTFDCKPRAKSPLLHIDNFISSPHAGAATREAALRTGVAAVEEVARLLREAGTE